MQTLSVGRDLEVNNDELKLMTESFQFHGARESVKTQIKDKWLNSGKRENLRKKQNSLSGDNGAVPLFLLRPSLSVVNVVRNAGCKKRRSLHRPASSNPK